MKTLEIKSKKIEKLYSQIIDVLEQGGLIIFPTETCYGIGCDATNAEAVGKMLTYKKRREGKPVSIAVSDETMAQQYVYVNKSAKNVYKTFLPGPITVISKSVGKVDPRLESENKTLGIRIPDYPFTLELLQKFGKPITATSANVAHKKTPYSYKDIISNTTLKQQAMIDLFLDAGELPQNPSSTVVDTTLNEEKVLRQGKITLTAAYSVVSNNETETKAIANKFFETHIEPLLGTSCVIVSLQGELGAGKTQFAKGIAKALGITEEVVSPTFNIVREYSFEKGMFYHIDTWRLHDEESVAQFIPPSYFQPGNLLVIEWSEKIGKFLKEIGNRNSTVLITVTIDHVNRNTRKISY